MKKVILCLAILFILPSCHRQAVTSRRTLDFKKEILTLQQSQATATPYVTVWVHGSRAFKPFDEYIHATPHQGMQTMTSLTKKHHIKKLAQILAAADPVKFPFDHFYAFGWSGDLSFEVRHDEAARLHAELEKLVATYTKKYGHAPFIRLITHSHGGNVALNLATIEHPNKEWFINEAIILASPVQHETENLVSSQIFGKVYSFYSTFDTSQVMDPQGLYKARNKSYKTLFSQRRFPDNATLIQTKCRINKHGVPHIGFISDKFIKHLPAIINSLDQWEEEQPHTAHEVRQLNLLL